MFKMNWSGLTNDQVIQEHGRDARYAAHARKTGNGTAEAHERHAEESASELRQRGLTPWGSPLDE